jgi:predicted nicotinamide N-methyase
MAESHDAFIERVCEMRSAPLVPELSFYLADENQTFWRQSEEALNEAGIQSPFWAFAWGGGQALSRLILDTPSWVSGKRVLDFASGCGIAAIAAAKAGARSVVASEIDPLSVRAISKNAELNGVHISPVLADLIGQDGPWDVILAGDVFYEDELGVRISEWLSWLSGAGKTVLIGDPGRHFLPKSKLELLKSYSTKTKRSLEDLDVGFAKVWTFSS